MSIAMDIAYPAPHHGCRYTLFRLIMLHLHKQIHLGNVGDIWPTINIDAAVAGFPVCLAPSNLMAIIGKVN
jgi:hypothetical protein